MPLTKNIKHFILWRLIRFCLCSFLFLTSITLFSQKGYGIKINYGSGKIKGDVVSYSQSYGYTTSEFEFKKFVDISFFYTLKAGKRSYFNLGPSLNQQDADYSYSSENHDPHDYGHDKSEDLESSFFSVGIPVSYSLRFHKTSLDFGINPQTVVYGKNHSTGHRKYSEYPATTVDENWDFYYNTPPFRMFIFGFNTGLTHHFSKMLSVNLSFQKAVISARNYKVYPYKSQWSMSFGAAICINRIKEDKPVFIRPQ